MQFRVRKAAHVLERIGLAMAGASSGLFVGTYVGSSIAALTSQGFLVVMMIGGAIGFYLGIDTPPLAFTDQMVSLQKAVPVERLILQNFSVLWAHFSLRWRLSHRSV
jgi:hypothetical protein